MSISADVGRRLYLRRRELGLTLRQVGARVGFTHSYVAQVEKGANTTVDSLERLANALDTTIEIQLESELRTKVENPTPLRKIDVVIARFVRIAPRVPDDEVEMFAAWVRLWEGRQGGTS